MSQALFAHRSGLLDTIRAVAVAMVVLFHVATRYPAESLDFTAAQFLRYGFLGVDVFYPLSGFLITRFLISHSGPGSIRTFFLRRVFRILPLYLVAVTVFYLAARITGFEAAALERIWATYFFLTGWFAFFSGPDSVPYTITWSLSVEEFAYVLFGLTAWKVRRGFPRVIVFLALAPILLRIWLYAGGYANIYYFPLARLDSIATGGLVAMLIGHYPRLWLVLAGATLLSLLARYLGGPVGSSALFTSVTLATCTVIAMCETVLRGRRNRLLDVTARIGLYSYFIYLFHFFNLYGLFMVFDKLGLDAPNFWVMGLLCMVVTYVQAALSFRYFEGPLMALGRHLENRRPAGLGALPADGGPQR